MTKNTAKILREQVFSKESPLYLPQQRAAFFPSVKKITETFSALKEALIVYTLTHKKLTPSAIEKNIQAVLSKAASVLEKEIKKTYCLFCNDKHDCSLCDKKAKAITASFIQDLPKIQRLILTDITAAFNGDPAAEDPYEIILCYPGFNAIVLQRMAHYLYKKGVAVIPRIITEYAHTITGADIHPGAQIDEGFFMDHATGVVIGATSIIGKNVKIYQGVTLGAKSFPLDKNGHPLKGIKRHPNVGDNVVIYANATILGNINIANGSVIGANTWITKDIKGKTKND